MPAAAGVFLQPFPEAALTSGCKDRKRNRRSLPPRYPCAVTIQSGLLSLNQVLGFRWCMRTVISKLSPEGTAENRPRRDPGQPSAVPAGLNHVSWCTQDWRPGLSSAVPSGLISFSRRHENPILSARCGPDGAAPETAAWSWPAACREGAPASLRATRRVPTGCPPARAGGENSWNPI